VLEDGGSDGQKEKKSKKDREFEQVLLPMLEEKKAALAETPSREMTRRSLQEKGKED